MEGTFLAMNFEKVNFARTKVPSLLELQVAVFIAIGKSLVLVKLASGFFFGSKIKPLGQSIAVPGSNKDEMHRSAHAATKQYAPSAEVSGYGTAGGRRITPDKWKSNATTRKNIITSESSRVTRE